jgi:hypothetical protein
VAADSQNFNSRSLTEVSKAVVPEVQSFWGCSYKGLKCIAVNVPHEPLSTMDTQKFETPNNELEISNQGTLRRLTSYSTGRYENRNLSVIPQKPRTDFEHSLSVSPFVMEISPGLFATFKEPECVAGISSWLHSLSSIKASLFGSPVDCMDRSRRPIVLFPRRPPACRH